MTCEQAMAAIRALAVTRDHKRTSVDVTCLSLVEEVLTTVNDEDLAHMFRVAHNRPNALSEWRESISREVFARFTNSRREGLLPTEAEKHDV